MMMDDKVKILVLDDEVNITKSLRRLLLEYDCYDLHTANSGREALELLAGEPSMGVIVSDQRMPEMTGVEFLRRARELVPDAVRILLTGYADIQASIAAINQGAVFRYLTKPWDGDTLLQTIADAARHFRLVTENKRLHALVLKQKEELQQWNLRLKQRVLEQTAKIRDKNDQLAGANKQLQSSFSGTIEALAGLIEMRNKLRPGHSRNVAALVAAMADKLSLSEAEKNQVQAAGLLHDIGKITMSDKTLGCEPRTLNGAGLQEYRDHVIRGQAAIDRVSALREIGVLIRHHHERFDGNGFPDRLRGSGIPLGARIIAAADMFECKLVGGPEDDALSASLQALADEWGRSLDPGLRTCLEASAGEVYRHLDIRNEVQAKKINPKELKAGMQLLEDLYSGTGVLLLKKGTVFDGTAIEAVQRCSMIDPFERDIVVQVNLAEL